MCLIFVFSTCYKDTVVNWGYSVIARQVPALAEVISWASVCQWCLIVLYLVREIKLVHSSKHLGEKKKKKMLQKPMLLHLREHADSMDLFQHCKGFYLSAFNIEKKNH